MITLVTPSLRVGADRADAGFRPSHTLNEAAMLLLPFAEASFVDRTWLISINPSAVVELIRPGVTILPVASIFIASAGSGTPAPTATITPLRISTVALEIGALLTGKTLA